MVVPRNMDIHYITPMNHPADERDSTTVTTHFDYHSINDRLVKLDILGHDDPTVIKLLEEFTHIKPTKIPIGDLIYSAMMTRRLSSCWKNLLILNLLKFLSATKLQCLFSAIRKLSA